MVLISLTEKGKAANRHHRKFHEGMIQALVKDLNEQEQEIFREIPIEFERVFLFVSEEIRVVIVNWHLGIFIQFWRVFQNRINIFRFNIAKVGIFLPPGMVRDRFLRFFDENLLVGNRFLFCFLLWCEDL